MRWQKWLAGILAAAGLGISSTWADTIFLLNGDELTGKIIDENDSSITLKEDASGRLRSIRRASIDVIVYDNKFKQETKEVAAPPASSKSTPSTGESTEKKTDTKKTDGEKPGDEKKSGDEKKAADGKSGDTKKKGEDKKKTADGAKETAKKDGEKKDGESTEVAKKDGEKKDGETEKKDAEAKDGEEKKAEEPPKLTEDQQRTFDTAVKKLEDKDPVERAAGKEALKGLGAVALPEIVKVLNHINPDVRATIATLLGELRAASTIKHQIEVFYSAMPEEGQCATYQRVFIRALKESLAATTGKSFITVEADKPLVQEGLKKYVDWYNENYDRLNFPAQIGEPTVDPTDPEYMKKIVEARKLKLEKRNWPRPSMFEGLGNVQKIAEPKPIIRPQDEAYKKEALPKVDRKSAGGYFRESDQKYSDDFYKKKE